MPSVRDPKGNVDGLPIVVLEAMAAGKPVVGTAVSGLPLAVLPGETGLLVPEKDPAALAAAISGLLADPARRRGDGPGGREAGARGAQLGRDRRHPRPALRPGGGRRRKGLMRGLSSAGPRLFVLALVAGLVVGAWQGLHWWADGFPLLLADQALRAVGWAAIAAAVFLLGFALVAKVLGRRLPGLAGTALATAVAGAPVLAVFGYHANRAWGIRPSELATGYGLSRNLGLVALGLAVGAAVCLFLWRAADADVEGGTLRRWRGALALFVLLGLAHLGVERAFVARAEGTPETPIVVLLVDALRPDRLGCYGHSRPTSPAIDRLAEDGVRFAQAVTASTFTKSSVASIFTGRYPFQHGVYWGSSRETPGAVTSDLLPESETTIAEALARHGYLTNAWVQNSHLRGFMGFDQGFLDYRDQQGPISRIHRLFGRFLAGPGRRYGFFTYLHYIDLHDPYRPRPPYDTMFRPAGAGEGDPYAGIDLANWGTFLAEVREGKRAL